MMAKGFLRSFRKLQSVEMKKLLISITMATPLFLLRLMSDCYKKLMAVKRFCYISQNLLAFQIGNR